MASFLAQYPDRVQRSLEKVCSLTLLKYQDLQPSTEAGAGAAQVAGAAHVAGAGAGAAQVGAGPQVAGAGAGPHQDPLSMEPAEPDLEDLATRFLR